MSMKRMIRLICTSGCLALLSDIAPMGRVARADVAGPTYIHRLQRVGYEVLAEPGSIEWFAQNAVGLGVVLCALAFGLMILLYRKYGWQMRRTKWFDRIREAVHAHLIAFYVCLVLLIVGLGLFGTYQFGREILANFERAARGGMVYVDGPGWKYPTELTESERADFNARLSTLSTRLSEKIEVEWRKNSWNGSEEHAKKVLVEVLKGDPEFRSTCSGIPLELIVDRYFVTEQWYNQGRHSFTHPKTMPWETMPARYEAQNRRGDEVDAAVDHHKFIDEQ